MNFEEKNQHHQSHHVSYPQLSIALPSYHNTYQGFDAAGKAIFECTGRDTIAAKLIFPKWAVPLSWLLLNTFDEGGRAIEPVSYDFLLSTPNTERFNQP